MTRDPVEVAADAAEHVLKAVRGLDRARRERDEDLRACHTVGGLPQSRVGEAVRAALLRRGWGAVEVRRMGVSDGLVRLVFRRG